jgi:ATP-binding cassette subfamily B multidrug efflux pump
MMHGRAGGFLNQETIKPRNLSETLGRLGKYFGRFWYMIVLAVFFVVVSTWTQVTSPELMGQATDCFLVPAGSSAFAQLASPTDSIQETVSSCWLGTTEDPSTLSYSRQIIYKAYHLGGYTTPDLATATNDERIEGMLRLILIVIALYVIGAVLTGTTFFTMAWTGQHVLRVLRVEVFEKLHQLSMSYYAEHEAGDLMSRITNDTSAIEQAFSFALVNVFSGILLLLWVAYNMLTLSLPFALLSLAVSPLMFIATVWFSGQARKAFRKSREEIGNVNAELQETISRRSMQPIAMRMCELWLTHLRWLRHWKPFLTLVLPLSQVWVAGTS